MHSWIYRFEGSHVDPKGAWGDFWLYIFWAECYPPYGIISGTNYDQQVRSRRIIHTKVWYVWSSVLSLRGVKHQKCIFLCFSRVVCWPHAWVYVVDSFVLFRTCVWIYFCWLRAISDGHLNLVDQYLKFCFLGFQFTMVLYTGNQVMKIGEM